MFAAPIQTLRIKTFSHPQMGLSFFPKKKINLGIHHFVTIPIIPYQTPKNMVKLSLKLHYPPGKTN